MASQNTTQSRSQYSSASRSASQSQQDPVQAFTMDVAELVQNLAKHYGLEEIEIHMHEPAVIATRGCLRVQGQPPQRVEMAVMISRNMQQAEQTNLSAKAINEAVPVAAPSMIHQSFDLSEARMIGAAANGDQLQEKNPCE